MRMLSRQHLLMAEIEPGECCRRHGPADGINDHERIKRRISGEHRIDPDDADRADAKERHHRGRHGIAVAAHRIRNGFHHHADGFGQHDEENACNGNFHHGFTVRKEAEDASFENEHNRDHHHGSTEIEPH